MGGGIPSAVTCKILDGDGSRLPTMMNGGICAGGSKSGGVSRQAVRPSTPRNSEARARDCPTRSTDKTRPFAELGDWSKSLGAHRALGPDIGVTVRTAIGRIVRRFALAAIGARRTRGSWKDERDRRWDR